MFTKEKLQQILNENIIEIKKTDYGITNDNYIIKTDSNSYFYRVAKDSVNIINKENEKEVIELLKDENYFLVPYFYNTNNLITQYQKNSSTFISQRNLSNIVEIAKLLKNFHNKKFQVKNEFNPIKTFNSYLEQITEFDKDISHFIYLVDEITKIHNSDRLCHNDLVEGNFLFTPSKLFLIDFEYAGLNDYYFDLASFISENDLNYQETVTFLKSYFIEEKCDFKKLDIYLRFCDLLWYTWAWLLYEKRHEEVYKQISEQKYHSLKNPRIIKY